MEVNDESFDEESNEGDSATVAGVFSHVLKSVGDTSASDCESYVDMPNSAVTGSLVIVRSTSGNRGSSGGISLGRSKIELTFSGSVRSVGSKDDVDTGTIVTLW